MKVRWTRSSLRLRITPSELEALLRRQSVVEELAFPGNGSWRVTIAVGVDKTEILQQGSVVRISLADEDCSRLSAVGSEGIYFHTEVEPALRYYIEKDFPCVHPRAFEAQEPASEAFTPPPGFEERKM